MGVQIVALTALNPGAENALHKYLSVVGPLMESANAKILHRYELAESIAGSNDCQFVTIIEYPDQAAISKVFDSEEYKTLVEVKKLAFSNYQVNVVNTN